jgi:DNA-binding XRE family transcriptional regulator
MNVHIDHQIIHHNGTPMFVIVPYDQYQALLESSGLHDTIPHEVVKKSLVEGLGLIRAWREYLGLTQKEVAERMGISQAALSQMESGEKKLRNTTRKKLASALGINPEQLIEG